ncbi:MAG TPA: CotH kinase family protein [Niabella sp.]|nr:CotH kinase family protein [Niabella sp.]HQW14883.1 CotH kinase family protein [Niabella sp.]HQX18492.1 CotH kinase family protein [Niabella sp.]HQX41490.1 CotH kinase family protein [Niabella sp.]HRB06019.1 CotH kinase family protein [Niabella sp.]
MKKSYLRIAIAGMYCLMLTSLLAACSKNEEVKKQDPPPPIVDTRDSTIKVTSFILEKKNNPQLLNDIVLTVNGDNITGRLSKFHHNIIPSFASNASKVLLNSLDQTSGTSIVDFRKDTVYSFYAENGKRHDFKIRINWNDSLPHLTINTNGNTPITSKDDYLKATVSIDGKGIYNNFSASTQIKGRGNSTWSYPKKPYRLKLDSKASLFGLAEEKDWVLLANYLDETHLLNSIAFTMGKKLSMPYTNNFIPVELTINGTYKGLYLFTEQVELDDNRVNVGDDGLLLEMDAYYDEDWKFKSDNYQLPVMVKDPEPDNATQLAQIKSQFQQMENLVWASSFPNNNYADYIDPRSVANFLIVYLLTDNEELNHPKSTYMHKTATGKFSMGPIWDFDWAYGYEGTQKHFVHYNNFFWQGSKSKPGTKFFSRFLADPQVVTILKQKWASFTSTNNLESLVNEWAYLNEGARNRDYSLWKRGSANYQTDINALNTWLKNRVNYLTTYINGL